MNELKLTIDYKNFPHTNSNNVSDWAAIKLEVLHNSSLVYSVFDIEWNAIPLLEWFKSNKDKILHEILVLNNESSLAESIHNYYSNEEIGMLDSELFLYRKSHGIRFGLRGTDIPDIYIGKSKEGYELSIFTNEINVKYLIDINQFYNSLG